MLLQRIDFNISFFDEPKNDPMATEYAHVNNVSLQILPETPSLLEQYSDNPEGKGPPATSVTGLGWNIVELGPSDSNGLIANDVADIVINNFDDGKLTQALASP